MSNTPSETATETAAPTTPTSTSTPVITTTPTTTPSSTPRTTPTTTRTGTSTASLPTTPGVTTTPPPATPTVTSITNTITDATGGLFSDTGDSEPGSGGSSNVGTIVGASVGGVIALALIGLIWFILARKRRERRHKMYDNDIFNPDNTVRGPNFDLGAGPGPETIPDPYTFDNRPNAGPGHPMSPTHYYDATSATSAGPTVPGLAGMGAAGALGAAAYGQHRHSGESGTPTTEAFSSGSSGQPLTGRAAKEREAFSRSGRMSQSTASPILAPGMLSPQATANGSAYGPGAAYNYGMGAAPTATSGSQYSSESGAAGSPVRSQQSHGPLRGAGLGLANPDQIGRTGTPGNVVVHQDAGRVREEDDEEEHLQELPPTYNS
ncbi:hypothetical protein BKA62DRAFT_743430 [Auriculariales sp. MPI-PUGE-AT-0066]|nr:hypothetical protein BKA62DRAFT_743430 [Auriculariales sp. MPI-PUGE-AT-0066]